jgi:hypothetical protein
MTMGRNEARNLENAILNLIASGRRVESDGRFIYIRSGQYGATIIARKSDLDPQHRGVSSSYASSIIDKYAKGYNRQ